MSSPWYAVLGQPVSHSRSPVIHQAFAAQFGMPLRYERMEVAAGKLRVRLEELRSQGLAGANITLPLKNEAAGICTGMSLRASRAGAVNTLRSESGGQWYGDNTDGAGLMQDLLGRQQVVITGQRVLLLGAGGAAAGILPALLELAPGSVSVSNRSAGRALALAGRHGLQCLLADELAQAGRFDLVFNASAAGHEQPTLELPHSLVDADSVVCDLSYGTAALPFLNWARAAGVRRRIDGLGMLVEQAALAFALWFGQRPQTEPVYQQLRASLVP